MLTTREGKPYRTAFAPNPITQQQTRIKDQLVLHNFNFKQEVVVNPKKTKKKEIVVEKPDVEKFMQEAMHAPVEAHETPEPEEMPVAESEPEGIATVWCLPAYTKERKDDFYGERRTSVQYGQKFQFEARITDINDLQLELVTSDTRITRNSVLYPSHLDGAILEHHRWWKVTRLDIDADMILLTCMPSDLQPDFS